jgi:RNA polymerase sigma factor (sigma-70 family)
MKHYTDSEILLSLRRREGEVVYYLSGRYLPMIRLMISKWGGTSEDAKDIFQDALLIMLQKIDRDDFILTCKFRTFLYCICENLWKNAIRKKKAFGNYFSRRIESGDEPDFTEIYDNELVEEMFNRMFDTLSPLCKSILKLYWEEIPAQDIAGKLNYAYSYVRKKKCECQEELIRKIKDLPEYKSLQASSDRAETIQYDI